MISKMTKEEEGDQGAAGAGPIDGRTQCSEYSKSNNQLILESTGCFDQETGKQVKNLSCLECVGTPAGNMCVNSQFDSTPCPSLGIDCHLRTLRRS